MADGLVLAQPAYSNPGQPVQQAIGAIEAGQGLRARSDAMQRNRVLNARDDQEFARQQKIRELMSAGKEDEAKSLMTLQERGQLVNIWSNAIDLQSKKQELDMQEQVFRDSSGLQSRAMALNTNADDLPEQAAALVTEAAGSVARNPKLGAALSPVIVAKQNEWTLKQQNKPGTVEYDKKRIAAAVASQGALNAEQKATLGPVAEKATADMHIIVGQNKPAAERLAELDQWQAVNAGLLSGVVGKEMSDAFDAAHSKLIDEMRATRTATGGTTVFERTLEKLLENGEITQDQVDEFRRKFLEVYTTPRAKDESDMEKAFRDLTGKPRPGSVGPALAAPARPKGLPAGFEWNPTAQRWERKKG